MGKTENASEQEIHILTPDSATNSSSVFIVLGNEKDAKPEEILQLYKAYGEPDHVIFILVEHRGDGQSVTSDPDQTSDRYDRITEPLDWYINDSPFGGSILSTAQVNEVMRWAMIQQETQRSTEIVGLFGALEFRFLNGPVFTDKEYIDSGRILAVGETPKTEYYWFEGLQF